ncbi:COG1361 family protein [Dongshaea marina]|uniref:hypothetical protein n=1 Tax=Dongshaea marina TaxID=2047966 RepID=UPI00131EEC97|nr:hypothetical protein [Dongshaea marina]
MVNSDAPYTDTQNSLIYNFAEGYNSDNPPVTQANVVFEDMNNSQISALSMTTMVGEATQSQVQLVNTGNAPATLGELSGLQLPLGASFDDPQCASSALQPNQACTLDLNLNSNKQAQVGSGSQTLIDTVANNQSGDPSLTINYSVQAAPQPHVVFENSQNQVITSLDTSTTPSASQDYLVKLVNTGEAPAALSNLSALQLPLAAAFSNAQCLQAPLAANESCSVTITLNPNRDAQVSSGSQTLTDVVADNQGGDPILSINYSIQDAASCTDPNASSYPAYDSGITYQAGVKVSYKHFIWRTKWYADKGMAPGQGSNQSGGSPWELVKPADMLFDWSANVVYQAGTRQCITVSSTRLVNMSMARLQKSGHQSSRNPLPGITCGLI